MPQTLRRPDPVKRSRQSVPIITAGRIYGPDRRNRVDGLDYRLDYRLHYRLHDRLDYRLYDRRGIDRLDYRLGHRLDDRRGIDGLDDSRAAENIQRRADKADDISRQPDAAVTAARRRSAVMMRRRSAVMMSVMVRRSGERLTGKHAHCRQKNQNFCCFHVHRSLDSVYMLYYTPKKSFFIIKNEEI